MSDHIPEDFWPEILKWLPVKSLARFRCVCRQWNALICSSSFIADHHACSRAKPRLFIDNVFQKPPKQKTSVICNSDSSAATFFPQIITAQIPALKGVHFCELVGSAKGILCFNAHHNYSERLGILLWNPVINKYIKLPKADPRYTSIWGCSSIAIGVKPSEEDDLRVLVFDSEGKFGSVAAEIYSVREGAWRSLQANIPRCYIPDSEVIYNGYGDFHCVALDNASSYQLIRFGFEEEEFNCIALPDVLAHSNYSRLSVAVYCGRLALLQRNCKDPRLKIWTRGDQYGNVADSWSVIICIDPLDYCYSILGIIHDCQILVRDNDANLVLYNLTSRTRHKLDMKAPWRAPRACPFVESLVFMDGDDTRLKQSTAPLVRRSGRARGTPKYLEDYSCW